MIWNDAIGDERKGPIYYAVLDTLGRPGGFWICLSNRVVDVVVVTRKAFDKKKWGLHDHICDTRVILK